MMGKGDAIDLSVFAVKRIIPFEGWRHLSVVSCDNQTMTLQRGNGGAAEGGNPACRGDQTHTAALPVSGSLRGHGNPTRPPLIRS